MAGAFRGAGFLVGEKHDNEQKKSLVLLLGLLLSAMVWVGLEQKAKAQEPIVIVIDPGHGGENRGGEYEQYVEKK